MTLNYNRLDEDDFKTIMSTMNTAINVFTEDAKQNNAGDAEWQHINNLASIVTKIQLELAESKFHGRL